MGDCGIGARLRERRIELGWSLSRLAEILGLSRQQVQKFETGINRISADQLAVCCRAMGISADAVLGLREEAPPAASAVDEEARKLLAVFRALPREERRQVLRAARTLAADVHPAAA